MCKQDIINAIEILQTYTQLNEDNSDFKRQFRKIDSTLSNLECWAIEDEQL